MSLDYESLFSKIDKAKKKRWSQADTDKWTKQQKEDKEKRPNIKRETIPFDNSAKRGPYRRSSQERDRLLGEKGSEETGGILSAAQRKARAAQAKLHGKKTGTETEPEHITRVPLTAEARRGRKRNAKRRKQEGKDKEAERIRAERGFPEKTPKQDEKARDRKDLESDLATKMPFVSQGEKGTKERTTAETKIIREHRERKAYAKRHSAARYQKWLKELDTEDRSVAERGEEADKEKKTKKQKRGKVVHATDQEAEYKRLMEEAGRVPGKTIKPSSDTISAKRSRADRRARAAEQAKPEEDTSTFDSEDPIEDIPDIEAEDDERGDTTKSLWKAGWKDEGFRDEEDQKAYQDAMGMDAPTPKGWKDIETTRAARKRTRSGRTDDKETTETLHHGPDEVVYDARVAGYGRDNPREQDRAVPLPRVEGTAAVEESGAGEEESALGQARGVRNVIESKRRGRDARRTAINSERISRQRTIDRVLAEKLVGKALAIKIKYEKGYSKHGSAEGKRIALNERHRKRWHSKDPKDMEWKAAKLARDKKSSEKHGNWKVHRNRHLHQVRGSGQTVLTPEQEAKRIREKERSEILQEGRYQTGQGSEYDKKVVSGRYRREAGYDSKYDVR